MTLIRGLLLFFFILSTEPGSAFEIPDLKVGSGSLFELKLSSGIAQIAITVANRTSSDVALEFYFKDQSFTGIEMWQRFHVQPNGKKLSLSQGYVLMPQLGGDPFILTDEYLKGFDGAQISTFMFESADELRQSKVGIEKITVPAGTVEATHYRIIDRDQTVDFWIHESAKPIGIVKMISTGKSLKHNYSLELKSLMTNSAPKIDPKKARPLTKEAKEFLPKPGTSLMMD
jgi:hypothetical protein